ncbi:MAG: peptidylprolyl isomerase [Nitriliruptoraceae bacterium]|nr:peptidylprolyl isomerase [Nitriliruptoraceae bacterium]
MPRSLRPLLFGILAFALTACGGAFGGPAVTAPDEAARIGDVQITRAELTSGVEQLLELQESIAGDLDIDITPELRREAIAQIQSEQLGQLVNREIAIAAALEVGVTRAEIDAVAAENEAGLLEETGGEEGFIELLRDNGLTRDVAVDVVLTGAAARGLLEERVGDQVRSADTLPTREARHILVPDAGDAAEVLAELRAGVDFAELAQERSEDVGSALQGGQLGSATRGAYVGPFDDAVWQAELGEVVGPIETQFGFHVLEVTGESEVEIAEASQQQLAQAVSGELARILSSISERVRIDPAFGTWDAPSQALQPATRVGSGAEVLPGLGP